jgi:hypothetical protein
MQQLKTTTLWRRCVCLGALVFGAGCEPDLTPEQADDDPPAEVATAAASLRTTGPIADATVQDGYVNLNDGRGSFLYAADVGRTGDTRNYVSYLRFDLTGLSTVSRATLRLTGRLQANGPASVPVSVYTITGTWTETGVTWRNRPALATEVVRRGVAAGAEATYDWDITALVQSKLLEGRASVDLALVAGRSTLGRVRFSSRDRALGAPALIVDEVAVTPPPPAPTPPPPEPTPPPPEPTPPPPTPTPPPPATGPTIAGCPAFPADNEWNRNIAADPVDALSAHYIAAMNGASKFLKADFGGAGEYGIPWITVPGNQPRMPVQFDYADESDPGPYPIPANAPIEGGPASTGDRHVLVVDRDSCKLYETFDTHPLGTGWWAASGAIFDLRSNALRPLGWTSADAAGLPVLPGLVRLDEVRSGRIAHALRFTVARTQRAYVLPATHYASSSTDPNLPPLGIRVRLKAGYDLTRFSPNIRVILTALKEYGMFLADNGSDWFMTGEANVGWNDDELRQLGGVPASAFEVVKTGTIHR